MEPETLEEYFPPLPTEAKEYFLEQLINPKMLEFILIQATIDPLPNPREKYTAMYETMKALYSACKETDKDIKTLGETMHKLDSWCGTNLPDDQREITPKQIKLLDEDLIKFAGYLQTGYLNLVREEAKIFLKLFSNLIYNFHGYQAPFRLDMKTAFRDAAGLTDHFSELWEKLIENKMDPSKIMSPLIKT